MKQIKDITKVEFLKAFNQLRQIYNRSVNIKEIAKILNIDYKDLIKHFKIKIIIDIKDYSYHLGHNSNIVRFKKQKR